MIKISNLKAQPIEFQIAISIGICMVLAYFFPYLQLLSACTAALMVTQDAGKTTFLTAVLRLKVTLIGAIFGVLAVYGNVFFQNYWIFIFLCAAGILMTFWFCRLFDTPPIACRIGCITLILIVIMSKDEASITYSMHRLVATLIGGLVAIGISYVFGRKKKNIGF